MSSKVFVIFLVLACLITHTVSEQNAKSDANQLESNGAKDDLKLKTNGDGKQVVAEPTAIDPETSRWCCPKVMKPIVLTAKPRYKWVVVPPNLQANSDANPLESNGDGNQVFAEPTAIEPETSRRCCPMVMKPIIPTAEPQYKWVVVPQLSVITTA